MIDDSVYLIYNSKCFISEVDKEFNLVMITEHFMESSVLLRRTMCWGLGDILFASINKRLYLQKGEPFHPELIKMHRKWNLGKDIWLFRNRNEKMNHCLSCGQGMSIEKIAGVHQLWCLPELQ